MFTFIIQKTPNKMFIIPTHFFLPRQKKEKLVKPGLSNEHAAIFSALKCPYTVK